jgi:anaphase-promoting complex subunit 4
MAGVTLSLGGPNETVKVLDLKFVDDEQLMLLLKEGGKYRPPCFRVIKVLTRYMIDIAHLVGIKYRGETSDITLNTHVEGATKLSQLPHGSPYPIQVKNLHSGPTSWRSCIKHTFAPEDMFKPLKIEVNGRKTRRFVVVVGEDLRQLRILDLDFTEGEERQERIRRRGGNEEDSMSE